MSNPGACEKVQQKKKMIAVKFDDLSSTISTYMVEGEKQLLKVTL